MYLSGVAEGLGDGGLVGARLGVADGASDGDVRGDAGCWSVESAALGEH